MARKGRPFLILGNWQKAEDAPAGRGRSPHPVRRSVLLAQADTARSADPVTLDNLIFALLLFLVSALVFTMLAQWLRLGLIVGYLAAGVAIGPCSPNEKAKAARAVYSVVKGQKQGVIVLAFSLAAV